MKLQNLSNIWLLFSLAILILNVFLEANLDIQFWSALIISNVYYCAARVAARDINVTVKRANDS